MKLFNCLVFIMIFFGIGSNLYAKGCDTHETCEIGHICHCTITPSSAYHRYFYFELSSLRKTHIYQCDIRGGPSNLSIELSKSQFPRGVKYDCQGACPSFPLTLGLSTMEMVEEMGSVSLKYFVPASDIPAEVNVYCEIVS